MAPLSRLRPLSPKWKWFSTPRETRGPPRLFGETANSRGGPRVSLGVENHFHLGDKGLRRDRGAIPRVTKNLFDQLRGRFDSCIRSFDCRRTLSHGLWFRGIEFGLCLLAA